MDATQAKATRAGDSHADASTMTDGALPIDLEQGAAELRQPAFLDEEGPMEPPAHVSTSRLRDLLASLTESELAAWNRNSAQLGALPAGSPGTFREFMRGDLPDADSAVSV